MVRYAASVNKYHWHQPVRVEHPCEPAPEPESFESKQELDAIFAGGSESEEPSKEFLADTPWGDIIVVKCAYPPSPGDQWDIPTALWCLWHRRTIYYCHEMKRLWCDGGPEDYPYHTFQLKAVVGEAHLIGDEDPE